MRLEFRSWPISAVSAQWRGQRSASRAVAELKLRLRTRHEQRLN